jgi:hypothetical protein
MWLQPASLGGSKPDDEQKLATSGKIRALGTLRLMREVAISTPRTA